MWIHKRYHSVNSVSPKTFKSGCFSVSPPLSPSTKLSLCHQGHCKNSHWCHSSIHFQIMHQQFEYMWLWLLFWGEGPQGALGLQNPKNQYSYNCLVATRDTVNSPPFFLGLRILFRNAKTQNGGRSQDLLRTKVPCYLNYTSSNKCKRLTRWCFSHLPYFITKLKELFYSRQGIPSKLKALGLLPKNLHLQWYFQELTMASNQWFLRNNTAYY